MRGEKTPLIGLRGKAEVQSSKKAGKGRVYDLIACVTCEEDPFIFITIIIATITLW
jgi:hypothetical protein